MPQEITLEMMRESLYSAVVSDALDSLGFRNQSPRLNFPIRTASQVLVGRCKTTLWANMAHPDPDPYALELKAVDGCQPDAIFIAAAQGSMRSGIWGELLSTAAKNRGCVGAIVDGAVRDVRKMREMAFPIIARSTCVYDSRDRQRVVDIDIPVEIGGVLFEPGSLVIADEDGIVAVPLSVECEAIRAAWTKVHAENQVRDEIRNGSLAAEVFRKYGVL